MHSSRPNIRGATVLFQHRRRKPSEKAKPKTRVGTTICLLNGLALMALLMTAWSNTTVRLLEQSWKKQRATMSGKKSHFVASSTRSLIMRLPEFLQTAYPPFLGWILMRYSNE